MATQTPYGFQAFQVAVDTSTAGDHTIIAAQTGHQIRVVSMLLWSSNTNSITIKKGSTTLMGPVDIDSKNGFVLGLNEYGWFWANAGEAFVINTSHKHRLTGTITYFLAL